MVEAQTKTFLIIYQTLFFKYLFLIIIKGILKTFVEQKY